MWLRRHIFDRTQQIMQIRHIIAPAYQRFFVIVYIGAIYVFLVSHCFTWNKQKNST